MKKKITKENWNEKKENPTEDRIRIKYVERNEWEKW